MALDTTSRGQQDNLVRMDSGPLNDRVHQYTSQNGKSYVSPSVQDEYNEEVQWPARIPSPPMSETSNPPSMEQQTTLTDEVKAHLTEEIRKETERMRKELVEQLKQSGNMETPTEHSKADIVQNLELTADEPESEPMARGPSNDKSCSTPSPPPSVDRVYTPPSPNVGARRATISSTSPPLSPVRSPLASPTIEKPSVRFMNVRSPVEKDGGRNARAAAYAALVSTELTAVDLRWGMLFDGDLNPTPRLGQFLRGLANRIISDFRPRKNIVVTPDKMAAFYKDFSVDNEVHPLINIFESQSHENLSVLYQDLDCQHHLVQEESFKKPVIPGLTPEGFSQWMTTWILAYPEQEAKRLQMIVVGLPIDADGTSVDGKPERLPKQISRHLLPIREDSDCKKDINEAIFNFLDDLGVSKTRKPSITNSPNSQRLSSPPQPKIRPIDIPQMNSAAKVIERDESADRESPSSSGNIKEPPKIERLRQPYTAKPGSGKVYMDSLTAPNPTRRERAYSTGRSTRDHEPEPEYRPRHIRSQSNASNDQSLQLPRSNGSRRTRSPTFSKFINPNLFSVDIGGDHIPETFKSPPKQSQSLSPTSYTTSKYAPPPSEMKERDPHRDHDRYENNRRLERRTSTGQSRSRRNTLTDSSRLPPDITTPRNAEHWDRLYENRDKSRDTDRRSEPKSAGPILHQEFRPNARAIEPDLPGEEYYLRPTVAPRSREYEVERGGKYYDRR